MYGVPYGVPCLKKGTDTLAQPDRRGEFPVFRLVVKVPVPFVTWRWPHDRGSSQNSEACMQWLPPLKHFRALFKLRLDLISSILHMRYGC